MSSALTTPQSIDDFLLFRMHRVLAHGGGTIRRLCEGQLGITWREWRLIASLKPGVAMLSSELAQHAQLDRARTSRGISSLVSKGLIDRQTVPNDQRKATVCLSDKGRAMYESFFPVVAELNHRLVQSLSANELAVLDKALTAIQLEAEKMLGDDGLPKANRRRSGNRD
jgi:DNA-binding MarR family transcriptional regulator